MHPAIVSRNIFSDSGVEWKNYRYFDPKTIGLDFQGMTEDLNSAPDGSVVVLHGEHLNRLGARVWQLQFEEAISVVILCKQQFPQ